MDGEPVKSPYFEGRLTGWGQTISRFAFEGILVSLVVQICMLPLLVIYFHRISFVSIILNLWVGFFIALESFTAVAGVLLVGVSENLAAPFFLLTEGTNWLLISLSRLLTSYTWSAIRPPAYTGNGSVIYLLYFLILVYIGWRLYNWQPFNNLRTRLSVILAAASFTILFFTILFHPFSAPMPDGRLRIDFLDVGQGDAALVTFPDGRTMLVDGGGRMRFKRDDEAESFEPDVRRIGESVVSEYLWHRGYSRIDILMATHADTDHIQGLVDVANNFSIGNAFTAHSDSDDPDAWNCVMCSPERASYFRH